MKSLSHSCPLWVLGPRAAHSKFGGGVIIGGTPLVRTRLNIIKQCCPGDFISGHLLHEIGTECGAYQSFNSQYAIKWSGLVKGIRQGDFPKIAAITAPAFGIPGIEDGAILSQDRSIRQMAWDLHQEAIEKSQWAESEGLGLGIVIWWPAFDGKTEYRRSHRNIATRDAWRMLHDFWCELLEDTKGQVHLEWKPKVPCRDYINSVRRAIRFCSEVNKNLGRIGMWVNNEWAHLLIGGTTVEEGTRLTIEADLFSGFFHAGSAELAVFRINEETGETIEGTPGEDEDWYVGAGGTERWNDQQSAVALIADCPLNIVAEHDIDPAGGDAIEYYEMSKVELDTMFARCQSAT